MQTGAGEVVNCDIFDKISVPFYLFLRWIYCGLRQIRNCPQRVLRPFPCPARSQANVPIPFFHAFFFAGSLASGTYVQTLPKKIPTCNLDPGKQPPGQFFRTLNLDIARLDIFPQTQRWFVQGGAVRQLCCDMAKHEPKPFCVFWTIDSELFFWRKIC